MSIERIRELNDTFRRRGIALLFAGWPVQSGRLGRILMTQGVAALPSTDQERILAKVANYRDFGPDKDPYREHDFGAFDHTGRRLFWKIDYYAPDMKHGSEDPADREKTLRVLTIMLAEEY